LEQLLGPGRDVLGLEQDLSTYADVILIKDQLDEVSLRLYRLRTGGKLSRIISIDKEASAISDYQSFFVMLKTSYLNYCALTNSATLIQVDNRKQRFL